MRRKPNSFRRCGYFSALRHGPQSRPNAVASRLLLSAFDKTLLPEQKVARRRRIRT